MSKSQVSIIVQKSIKISNYKHMYGTVCIKLLVLSIYLANIQESIASNIMRLYSSVCRNEKM